MRHIFLFLLSASMLHAVSAFSMPPGAPPASAPGSRLLYETFDRSDGLNLPTGWLTASSGSGGEWVITNNIGATVPDIPPIAPASGSGYYAGINGYFNAGAASSAWLYSKGLNLIAGRSYRVRFLAYATGLFDAEQIDLYIGVSPEAGGMTERLWNSADAGKVKVFNDLYAGEGDRWEAFEVRFTPLYTGVYYLGFHDRSSADEAFLAGIDEVEVTEMYTNDLRLTANGLPQVPASQVAAAVRVENVGAAAQTGIVLSATLNGVPMGSASAALLAPGGVTDALTVIAPPNPPGLVVGGSNTLIGTLSADAPDEMPDNNATTLTFTGTRVLYAADRATTYANGYGGTAPVSFGNIYPIYNPATLTAVGIGFASGAPLLYSISLYKMADGSAILPTDLLAAHSATRTASGLHYVPVPATPLEAGARYFLVINQLTNTSIAVAVDGTDAFCYRRDGTSVVPVYDEGAAVVRMVLSEAVCSEGEPVSLNAMVANTSASLTWNYSGDPFGYLVTVESGTHTATRFVTATSCTFDGLLSNAAYTWSVRAMCDGMQGGSPVFGADFVTAQPLCYTTLPWSESFTEAAFPPPCWLALDAGGMSPAWERTTWTVHTTPASARRRGAATTGPQDDWLISPPLTIPDNGARLTFRWKMGDAYNYERSSILLSTTGSDVADFTTELWVAPRATLDWQQEQIILPSEAAGQTVRLAFRYEGYSSAHIFYIDDILVEPPPAGVDAELVVLSRPSGITRTATEEVTVTVRNAGGVPLTDIPVSYQIDGGAMVNEVIPVTALAYGGTYAYSFSQRVDLSDNNAHTLTANVMMPGDVAPGNNTVIKSIPVYCATMVTAFPWTEAFNNGTPFPTVDDCWTTFATQGAMTWAANTSSGTANFHSAQGSARRRMTAGTSDDWLVTKPIVLPASGVSTLVFWERVTSAVSTTRNSVWISLSGTAPADFTEELWVYQSSTSINAWTERTVPIPANYAGQTVYLAFCYHGTTHEWYLDDISITNVTPPPPTELDASATAIVRPVGGSSHPLPEMVEVLIKNNGMQTLSSLSAGYSVDNNPPTMESVSIPSGLAPGETYAYTFATPADLTAPGTHTLRVFTLLPDDEVPANDTITTQIVTCGFAAWPFLETFGDGLSADFPPACWERASGGGSWTMLMTGGHSGLSFDAAARRQNNTTATTGDDLITPLIVLPATEAYDLSLWMRSTRSGTYSQNGRSSIGILDVHNTYTELWSAQLPYNNTWTNMRVSMIDYVGDSVRIVFRYEGQNAHHWQIDDITFVPVPSVSVALTSIDAPAAQSAGLSATEPVSITLRNLGSDTLTSVYIMLTVDGVIQTEGLPVNIAPGQSGQYTLTNTANLSAAGTHTITVTVSVIGDASTSDNMQTQPVYNCTLRTVPWSENFNATAALPSCWRVENTAGTTLTWETTTGYINDRSALHEGSVDTEEDWLITPRIIMPASGYYEFAFLSYIDGSAFNELCRVLIATTADAAPDDFLEIWSHTGAGMATAEEVRISLQDYLGDTVYLAFCYRGGSYLWSVDDVSIRAITHKDVAVTNVSVRSGALLGMAEPVTITLHNNGIPVSNVKVVCEINCATYTAVIPGIIAGLSDTTVTIPANMAIEGNYAIKAYIEFADDTDHSNDTLLASAVATRMEVIHFWDFAGGIIPPEFTLLRLDNGVPDATDVLNWAFYDAQLQGADMLTAMIRAYAIYLMIGPSFADNAAWSVRNFNTEQREAAVSVSMFSAGAPANRWMITPAITVQRFTRLSWKAWSATGNDGYEVRLSKTGLDPADFNTVLFSTSAENRAVTSHALNLVVEIGQPVYIAFVQNSNNKQFLFVDDILIEGSDDVICSGESFVFTPAIVEGSVFTWNRAAHPDINGGAPASGTGQINEQLVNGGMDNAMVTYHLSYQLADGCSMQDSILLMVSAIPELSTPSVADTVCSGFIVGYTPESATPDVLFDWTRLPATGILDANGQTSNSGTGDIYEILENNLHVPVTVTYRYTLNAHGCTNTQDVLVRVNPRATKPNVWTIGGSLEFCEGDTILVRAEAIGAVNYRWVLNESVTEITDGIYNPGNLAAGTYTITVVANNADDCASEKTGITIVVHERPTAPALTPAGDLVFCEGTAGSVTLTAGTVTGAVAYEWYKNGIWLEGVSGTTYFTSESGTYSVRAVNAIGCASPLAVPVTVVTLPLPTTPTVTLSGALEFCEGESALLQANAIDAATYTWYRNGGVLVDQTASLIEVTESGSYSVEVVSSNNCPAPPLRSETIVITVNAKPAQPSITFSPAGNVICEGDSRTLQIPTVPNATYNWYKDGLQVLNNSTSASLLITEAGFYQAEVVSDKGCISPISTPVELIVNSIPATPVITGDASACVGETILLTAESAGASTYVWYMNNIEVQRGISRTYEVNTDVTVNTSDTYTVKTISASGCSSTVSAGKAVDIEAYPDTPVIEGDPLVRKTRGSSYTFEVLTPDGDLQYQWYHAPKQTPEHRASAPVELWDGQGATLLRTNIQLSDAGEYYVIVITPKAGCFTKSAPVELLVEDEIKASNIITANGDGQNDRWIIEGLETYKSNELQIVNRYGNEVYRTSNYPTTEAEQARTGWDGTNLPDGVYFYSISLTDKDDTVIKRTGYVTLKH